MRLENFLIPFEDKDALHIYLEDKSNNIRLMTMHEAQLYYGNSNIIKAYYTPDRIMTTNTILTCLIDRWGLYNDK